MKGIFKLIQKDSVLRISFWLTLILVVVTVGAIGILYSNLPPFIPLYNHLPWGYARLGRLYELFIPPLAVCIILIINTVLGVKVLEKYPLLARFLFVTTLGIAAGTCIFIVRLIFLVI